MSNVVIQAAVVNNKGCVRGNNEDSFLLNGEFMARSAMNDGYCALRTCRDAVQVYSVCDGMGGADAGEEASYLAVSELARYRQEGRDLYHEQSVVGALRAKSDSVYEDSVAHSRKSGTTTVLMSIYENMATLAHVGDSRIYRMRGGKLTQMTSDHSEVQRLISIGLITPEQARVHPRRHVISQFMGMPTDIRVAPTVQQGIELQPGDVFLLCSDGLTDMVEDRDIEQIMRANDKIKIAAQELLKKALQNGGKDNVTVMLVRVAGVKKSGGKSGSRALNIALNVCKALVGCSLLMTIIDYIYYLLH